MSSKRKKPVKAGIAAAVIFVLAYIIYSIFSGSPAPQQHQMPPAAVTVEEINPADIPLTYEYSGRVAGSREVEIRARVSGILQKRSYAEGQAVKQGDVLFRIDPAPFEAELAEARATLTQSEKDWGRAEGLYKEKALSAREHDQAQGAYEQAKARLRTAQINLGYTTVTAPIAGVTSREGISEGSLVTADSTLLTRISQLDPIYIYFAIPDAEALWQRNEVANGNVILPEDKTLLAEIHLGDGIVYKDKAKVNFTDSIIDPQTGTVSSRAVVENPDGSLLPGQFVRVVVEGMSKVNAIAVADKAIMQGPMGTFVYVVTPEGKAGIAPVKLGPLNNGKRLIESGLKKGDRVVVEGMIKVVPDAPVVAQTVEEANAVQQAAVVKPKEKKEEQKNKPEAKPEQEKE